MTFSFNATPNENIAYFMAKDKELHFNYDEIMHEAHHKAFTIAKITKIDLLSFMQESISTALANGDSFEAWKKNIKPTLAKAGWLGKTQVANPQRGEIKEIFVGNRRLKNIFYTNMRTSYAQARARAQYELKDSVFLRYVSINDNRTRDSHKALHGLILHRDDPFWKRNYPPNGWNCRCKVQAYTKEQLESRGWEISKSPPPFKAHKDWDYDTRNLKASDNELQHIIEKKLESHANNPSAKVALQNILDEIKQSTKRYNELKELWESKNPQQTATICQTPKKLQEILNTKAEAINIKADTIIVHKGRHPEICSFDYSLVPYMLDNIDSIYQDEKSNVKYIIASKLGKWYRLSLKSLSDKKEIWVESLVSSSDKEKILSHLRKKRIIYGQ